MRINRFALAFTFILISLAGYSKESIVAVTDTDNIVWNSSLSLPATDDNAHLGLAGVFAAYIDGKLVVAGGANFPAGLPSEGGLKRWWSDVYVYDGSNWKIYKNILPSPVAYGCSIQLADGMLCIGGCNNEKCLDEVYILRLNPDGRDRKSVV